MQKKTHNGFAMLLSVLILGVIGVAISTTLLTLSISSSQTAATYDESQKAKATVAACEEKAIQALVLSPAATGIGSASVGAVPNIQTCAYLISTINSSTDLIQASSTVGQTTRRLLVRISIPQLVLLTWQEI